MRARGGRNVNQGFSPSIHHHFFIESHNSETCCRVRVTHIAAMCTDAFLTFSPALYARAPAAANHVTSKSPRITQGGSKKEITSSHSCDCETCCGVTQGDCRYTVLTDGRIFECKQLAIYERAPVATKHVTSSTSALGSHRGTAEKRSLLHIYVMVKRVAG